MSQLDPGYVYYEADCAMLFLNPFVPSCTDAPTVAAWTQKPLKVICTNIFNISPQMNGEIVNDSCHDFFIFRESQKHP